MRSVVSMNWVRERLDDPQLVIVDCRFVLGNPEAGRKAYDQAHLPGAYHMDLERDLSGPPGETGGRHPLPDIRELADKLGSIGVGPGKTVVAYDDQGGVMASRFWWLLQYMGHDGAFVMDEGFTRWKDEGFPVTDIVPSPRPFSFEPALRPGMMVDMEAVRKGLGDASRILIDSRDAARYHGWEDHVDPRAGHIPGAVHQFWKDSLNETGKWKTPEEQRKRFQHLDPDKEIVVYCGSGVTACANILALKEAGFSNVKLYPGSWSEWCGNPDNPIETDEK